MTRRVANSLQIKIYLASFNSFAILDRKDSCIFLFLDSLSSEPGLIFDAKIAVILFVITESQ